MQENGDNLVELLLLPKIGRAKAKVLHSHGYKNVADIAAADPLELSKVPGISLELAKEMVNFVKVMGSADSEKTHTITCPMCGTMVPDGTKSCTGCGITFTNEWDHAVGEKYTSGSTKEPDEEGDGHWQKKDKSTLFICPECGSLAADGSTKCPSCGVLFDDETDDTDDLSQFLAEDAEADGHRHKEQEQLFMCPNCGSFISADADGCNACGIVFEDDGEEELTAPEKPACPMCSTDLVEGAEVCNNCGFEFADSSKTTEQDEFWMKEQDGLFMCPNCGIFLPSSASQCSACGVAFEGEDSEEPDEEPDILFCPMCSQELTKGAEECTNCGFDFSAKADGFWIKNQKGLFMCPNCGSLAADGAESCPSCGVLFEEDADEEEPVPTAPPEPGQDKEEDGFWVKEQKGLSMCPGCGSFIASDANICNTCGIAFDDDEEELEKAPDFVACPMCQNMLPAASEGCNECGFDFTAEREQDGFWYKKSGSLFICPNCGAFLSEATETCHNCGLAFVDDDVMEEKVEKLIDSVELEHELDSVIDIDQPEEDVDGLKEDDGPPEDVDIEDLYLCPICGAFIEANLTKCPSCHTVFDDIEDIDLEPVSSLQEHIISPEALSKEISAEIEDIEAELLDRPLDSLESELEKPPDKKGVSKSFLDRWEKTDEKEEVKPSLISDFKKRWESSQLTDEEIEEDLGLGDLIVEDQEEEPLIADIEESDDHEFWSMRAKEHAIKGDVDEAIACLDRAAVLNPAREVEYKRRILELMGIAPIDEGIDLSDVVEIDELGDLAVDEQMVAEARLEELEEKLVNNPDDGTLWQEKGEILEQMNHHEEAIECYDKSINLSYSSLKKEAKPDLRLPSIGIGLTNGQGRVNGRINGLLIQRGLTNGRGKTNGLYGRTNGLVNGRGQINGMINGRGRTNGVVNGLTNGLIDGGLINGLMKGRTNGLTNGKVNGLTNGKVNGMTNGLINGGGGLINGGLVNGLGLVNGEGIADGARSLRRLRHRQRDRVLWRYRLSAMVMFVTIILMLSMLNNLMVQEEMGTIYIDSNFSDWNDVPSYYDSPLDQVHNADLNILESKILAERDRLSIYASVEGTILQGLGVGGNGTGNASQEFVDTFVTFVDLDDNAMTGYAVGGIGADMAADVYGWDNDAVKASTLVFNNDYGQDDWNGFDAYGTAQVAMGTSEIEVRINPPRTMGITPEHPKVVIMLQSSEGYSDMTDYLLSELPAALDVVSYSSGNDVLAIGSQDITLAQVTARSRLASPQITGFEFQIAGSANLDDVSNIRIINDTNGDGGQSVADLELEGTLIETSASEFTFTLNSPLIVPLNRTLDFWLILDLESTATGGTLGINLLNVSTEDSLAYTRNMNSMLHYVGSPSEISIDGAFGDWASISRNVDSSNDIIFQGQNSTLLNKNVDLADLRATTDGDLYVFLSVGGTMLGGEDIPTYRTRPSEPTDQDNITSDSDRDGVPDSVDPMPLDFDNDGINNTNENGDWDSDGNAEHPRGGTDYWLNTTIPSDFPASWADTFISIYVGPIGHVEELGYDSAYVMIDADDDVRTGTNVFGAMGMDYVALVTGKHNEIISSQLFEFDLSQGSEPWSYVSDIDSAIDWYRLELAIDPASMGMTTGSNFTVYASMEDWNHAYDVSDESVKMSLAVFRSYNPGGTRALDGSNVVLNEIAILPDNAEWVEVANPTALPIDMSGWEIQVNFRGWRTIYTWGAGSTIGAWGSGSEYSVASDPFSGPWWFFGNQLRSGWDIRLVDSTGTTIDETTIGNPGNGQTWARFKNDTYGMPDDTDSNADWYISNDGWIVPEGPTPGAPNDRKRPVIIVEKLGSSITALPGEIVTYTINFNNIGDGWAADVWVNDTLPAGIDYISASIPPSSISGNTYTWYFSHVAPGPNTFTITAQVNSSAAIGSVLTNLANLDYTDQRSRPMASSSDTWDIIVSTPLPAITVAKTVDSPTTSPGGTVIYTIYYNNTGSGNAGNVWINDTLPSDLTYVTASPSPTLVSGQDIYWSFNNVSTGDHSISLEVDVSIGAGIGTIITNTATLDYTDSSGSPIAGSSDSVTVTVVDATGVIVLNEIKAAPNNDEWIELANPSSVVVDISGWRIRVGLSYVHTFPAGSTIDAWGSGNEYLIVSLANELRNGGSFVRLYNDVGAVVDSVLYPGLSDTQSYARLKHEDTGKPIDTGGAGDWYLTNDGWIVPEGPTPGAANDRKMPVMSVEKIASLANAEPGQTVTYTIYYNNTGDGNAKNVWVNDTLPAGIDYVSAMPTPDSVSGQDISWHFPNVVHDSTNIIMITGTVNDVPADSESMVNSVDLNYFDQLKRPMGTVTGWANVTCLRPVISVEKVSDVTTAIAGGTITYTIYYNNTGSVNAGDVWINDTLPSGVTFSSASDSPTVIGSTVSWHLTNVAPGSNSVTVQVTVNATAPSGTIINWAYLDYASNYGYILESSSDSATVVIPEMQNLAIPIGGMILIIFIFNNRRSTYKQKRRLNNRTDN